MLNILLYHMFVTTQFFTGRMPFLLPSQQHQCTEGIQVMRVNSGMQKSTPYFTVFGADVQ